MQPLKIMAVCAALGVVSMAGGQERVALEPVFTDPSRLAIDWTLDGSGDWRMGGGVLTLAAPGTPAGPIRRPAALAVLNGDDFGDVTFEVEVQSTAALPDVTPRRDVLLIAGYQSPTRFYYAHISAARDDVHNGIFLVADADRRRIDTSSEVAPLIDREWHRARLVREASTGRIAVYFGEREAPIMTATDRTLSSGRVGVGSFDDTAAFRRARVWGVRSPDMRMPGD
jgi:hypothetical protein